MQTFLNNKLYGSTALGLYCCTALPLCSFVALRLYDHTFLINDSKAPRLYSSVALQLYDSKALLLYDYAFLNSEHYSSTAPQSDIAT